MKKIIITALLLLLSPQAYATPIDYDGNLFSDPSVVEVGEKLRWLSISNNDLSVIDEGFGNLGEHLAPGNYSGEQVVPGTISPEGIWKIRSAPNQTFGDEDSLFLAGSDLDGDGINDIATSTNACKRGRSVFKARVNPINNETVTEFKASRGYYYKFFMDVDGNGADELCTLVALKTNKILTGKFRAVCRNASDGSKVKSFKVGSVNEQPHPVKVAGQPDLLLISTQRASSTKLKFINTDGATVARSIVPAGDGTLVIGNYTSGTNQQAVVVKDNIGYVYDPILKADLNVVFPDGIAYDQINIVHFKDSEGCFCNTKTIKRNGSCTESVSDNLPQTPDTPGNTSGLFIPDNCANPPSNISQFDGFKCIASATRGGSVVCLLPYQFTWGPYKNVTDHHGFTFACSRNDTHFDDVDLVLKSGERIGMSYAGCHNYVSTPDGWIGRQHFRNESINWDSIKNKVRTIEMKKGSKQTCLSF